MSNRKTGRVCFLVLCPLSFVLSAALASHAAPMYRPERELRTINTDSFEVKVQKDGRVDVILRTMEIVFGDARPMAALAGQDQPEAIRLDARATAREAVTNRLGKGQGLYFKKGPYEWAIQTYPTQPYLSAQVAYVNEGKKPVTVRMLVPWATDDVEEGGCSLGPGTGDSAILHAGGLANPQARLMQVGDVDCVSLWNLAAYNSKTQRSLIAGFLTGTRAQTQIRLAKSARNPDAAFGVFRAECLFDPPVEVPPGSRLESEVVYLGISEPDPVLGLERFGQAVALFNDVQPVQSPLPHGWDPWSTKLRFDVNETNQLAALDFLDKNLGRYGWTHFSIDAGWECAKGDWEGDPAKFPHGMKWFADQVHARGMTAGLWTDPFTVSLDAPLAREHPDWLVGAGGLGKGMIGDNERILDITAPGAYEWVKDLYRKIAREWGYDALVETDFVYKLLLAEKYHDASTTRVAALRQGMSAIREGCGANTFIMGVPPMHITGLFADGMRVGVDCAPIWRKAPSKWPWGCVDTLTNAVQRFYCAPYLWVPDQDCAFFGLPETRARWDVTDCPELTEAQSIAWLTGAALTGGVIKLGDNLPDLDPRQVAILSRLLPTPAYPARPIDLFESKNPRIWALPIHCVIGDWTIVGVFNWDETAATSVGLSFPGLGLKADTPYTVYDFWQETYFGIARDRLDVSIAPSTVRLLGLRRYEGRPMFLATDRHFTQGASDFTALDWSDAGRTLSGSFNAVADTDYVLRILLPGGYAPKRVTLSSGKPQTSQDGAVLKIAFHNADKGALTWSAQF